MANGDDGYVNGGGGGSVWWEVGISEADFDEREVRGKFEHDGPDSKRTHETRQMKNGKVHYRLSGHDSFRESQAGADERAYFEIVIGDVGQIADIVLDGETLKIYLPVEKTPESKPQYSVRWGLHREKAAPGSPHVKAVLRTLARGPAGT